MALNLHAIVRGPINAVNPDTSGLWKVSTGFTTASDGTPTPSYTTLTGVMMQVQATTGPHLRHESFISQQGVKRVVYMYGDAQGSNRPDVKGGDLLIFPETRGGANKTWLITHVLETWAPDTAGWCCVGVVLQPDVTT